MHSRWAVALSTREDPSLAYHPMGRESILTPVTWNHGEWPIFDTAEGIMEGWPRPDPADIKGDGFATPGTICIGYY